VRRLERIALLAGLVGLVLFVVGLFIEPRQALTSYVFAYATVFTVVLGALIQLLMSHVTGARWFTVMRRVALGISGAMPAVVLLALPIFFGVAAIYSWTSPATLPREARLIVERKEAWLNAPFFIARGVVYLAAWVIVDAIVRRSSLGMDRSDGTSAANVAGRVRRLSAIGLVVVGLTMTFASFDWLMALDPTWYSTVYGVYVFAGGYLAALGLIAVISRTASGPAAPLNGAVTPEHFGALGKLQLTFVIFWGYIAFSQFLIIWIGDIPLDASWYVTRGAGSWGTLALIVVAGQFAIPFLVLLPRATKRRPSLMWALGVLLLTAHVLDVYWLVLPSLHPTRITFSWLDLASLLMVGGFATAFASWRARGVRALPIGDPYLAPAMSYIEP
jgi:hypothetical protein